jgi:hypothetical protein
MLRFLWHLLASVFTAGRRGNSESSMSRKRRAGTAGGDSSDERRVQFRVGEAGSDEWGKLQFAILKVYLNRKRTDAAPWHEEGGDWTFFDCRLVSSRSVGFTVGVRTKAEEGRQLQWGEATIAVTSRDEGAKFVEAAGEAFMEEPPQECDPQPLQPWMFSTAVLGENMNRDVEGGFYGQGGDWSATKWFLERDDRSAEVYFNYNLKLKAGEFSEKDSDYREDFLAILAEMLRDGPRPERTPETDPNLTDVGPKFGEPVLREPAARLFQFSPGGRFIAFAKRSSDGTTAIVAVPPDRPTQRMELDSRFQAIDRMAVLDPEVKQLLVLEVLPQEQGVISSNDPRRLWWVDRTTNEWRELNGPWDGKSFSLAEKPISSDGTLIAITEWRPRTDGLPGNKSVIHLLDRQSGASKTIELEDQSPEPIGWIGSGLETRLVCLKCHRWEVDQPQEWFLADPLTGGVSPAEHPPLPEDQSKRRLSPDGSLAVSLEKSASLSIDDVQTGVKRTFTFHEDDQRLVHEGVFQWVSPRYLQLYLNRLAFLDVNTLKMSYPLAKDDESHGHTFSPDFKWVVFHDSERNLCIQPVKLPPGGAK